MGHVITAWAQTHTPLQLVLDTFWRFKQFAFCLLKLKSNHFSILHDFILKSQIISTQWARRRRMGLPPCFIWVCLPSSHNGRLLRMRDKTYIDFCFFPNVTATALFFRKKLQFHKGNANRIGDHSENILEAEEGCKRERLLTYQTEGSWTEGKAEKQLDFHYWISEAKGTMTTFCLAVWGKCGLKRGWML